MAVRFLDVGQADSILITLPDGKTMLIDPGTLTAGSSIVTYISDLGVKKLDHVIFTHPHEDHIGGAPAVLKAFDVGQIYMPKTSHTTQTYENLLLAIQAKGLTITEAKAGTVIIDRENLKASLIGPVKSYSDLNDWSPILVLKYGSRVFVFPGDGSTTSEGDLLAAKTAPNADVLKVGHHGSSTSTGQAFLDALTPSVAVISVGSGNTYGHPTQTTLNRLTAVGAKIYRTDKNGTITVTTDGSTLEVTVEHQEAGPTGVAAPPPTQGAATDPSKITVYITKTGEKYHTSGCRYLSSSKIPISLKDAKARGYGPCSVCKPPT
jgi:competence protein ComEC